MLINAVLSYIKRKTRYTLLYSADLFSKKKVKKAPLLLYFRTDKSQVLNGGVMTSYSDDMFVFFKEA